MFSDGCQRVLAEFGSHNQLTIKAMLTEIIRELFSDPGNLPPRVYPYVTKRSSEHPSTNIEMMDEEWHSTADNKARPVILTDCQNFQVYTYRGLFSEEGLTGRIDSVTELTGSLVIFCVASNFEQSGRYRDCVIDLLETFRPAIEEDTGILLKSPTVLQGPQRMGKPNDEFVANIVRPVRVLTSHTLWREARPWMRTELSTTPTLT